MIFDVNLQTTIISTNVCVMVFFPSSDTFVYRKRYLNAISYNVRYVDLTIRSVNTSDKTLYTA